MSVIKTYDVTKLSVSFGGVRLGGFIDGEAVTIAPNNDEFTDVQGTDGEIARSYQGDSRRTVTIRLLGTSESNDVLNSAAVRRASALVVIRDGSGTARLEGPGWVSRRPDRGYGRDVPQCEWTLRVAARSDEITGTPADPI